MEVLDDLRNAAERLLEVDPWALSGDELGESLVDLAGIKARIAAGEAQLVASFEAGRSYVEDGSKTAASWLARRTGGSLAAWRAQARLARRLRHMPATFAALAAGEISERHAHVLADLAGSPRPIVAAAHRRRGPSSPRPPAPRRTCSTTPARCASRISWSRCATGSRSWTKTAPKTRPPPTTPPATSTCPRPSAATGH